MLTFLNRAWVPLVVVVAVTLGAVAVDRLRGVFGSDTIFNATGSSAEPLEPSHIKQVTYEVYGPRDTAGSVSYLDQNTQPAQANFTNLPWTFTITTTVPAMMANVVALGRWFWWPQRVWPRPASYMLRPFGPRRLVRSLLLGEDTDAATAKLPRQSGNGSGSQATSPQRVG